MGARKNIRYLTGKQRIVGLFIKSRIDSMDKIQQALHMDQCVILANEAINLVLF